jgi:4-amino-4-deoxy-L-arabinose transferase-like glycosyltransferase
MGLSSAPKLDAQPDQQYYEKIAYNLSIGNGYSVSDNGDNPQPTAIVMPGTSLTLLPIYVFFGHSYTAGRIWFILLSALTCVAVAVALQQLYDKPAAVLGAIVMAFYPNHFYYSMHFVSETPYTFYMAVALMFTAIMLRTQSNRYNILAGIFWGLMVLTRVQAVLLLPLALLTLMLLPWRSAKQYSLLKMYGVQALIIVLMLCPWLVRNTQLYGQPVLTTLSGYTLLDSHNDLIFNDPAYKKYQGSWLPYPEKLAELYPIQGNTLLERDQKAREYAIQSIRKNINKMPYLTWAKLLKFFTPHVDTPNKAVGLAFGAGWVFVGLFSIPGIWKSWRKNTEGTVILLLPIIMTLTTCLIFHSEPRYRDSASPAFVALAAIGIINFSQWFWQSLGTVGVNFARR